MNIENRYPVTASLFMLKEIKHRQEQVNRGYQLLKRKAEALRIRGRQTASELTSTQAMLGHTLREAYITLAAIKFTNGESNALVLENIGQAQVRVQRVPENISGVSTMSLQAVEETGVEDSMRYAGLGAGGHRTGEAKKAFREAVRILLKFASLRNTCILLDEAIRSTLRKVNGIEKVIMPKLRNTESYIMTEMDEREREEFHRLKMLKAKKIRTQARLLLRKAISAAGSGESQGAVSIGHGISAAISLPPFSLFEEWLERRHLHLFTFHLTQVLTGHGCFGRYLFGIKLEETPGCLHCVDNPEDMVEHTLEG